MSDIKTWDVTVLTPTACTATFVDVGGTKIPDGTDVKINTTIYAEFTWTNAIEKLGMFAKMFIFEPDGTTVAASWIEFAPNGSGNGSKTLSCLADKPRGWTASIQVGYIIDWVRCDDILMVNGAYAELSLNSTYEDGPFIPGTTHEICDLIVLNTGNIAEGINIELCEYPGEADEYQLSLVTTDPVPSDGGSVEQPFDVEIPGDTDTYMWPLGVRVWGVSEAKPTYPTASFSVSPAGVRNTSMLNSMIRPLLESESIRYTGR